MIIALAGRRIDSPGANPPRFPEDSVGAVRERIRALFAESGAAALVCSAACGADLIALSVAGELNMRRRIVLPFDRATFRQRSVADRPGPWGSLYDAILDEVAAASDIVVLPSDPSLDPYVSTNVAILDESMALGPINAVRAVIIWDGERREGQDHTVHFAMEARERGLEVVEVWTTGMLTRRGGGAV
jgi:hypothetical protein